MKNKIKFDGVMVILSILYLVLPLIIFFFGWLKLPLAIIFSAIFAIFGYKLYQSITDGQEPVQLLGNKKNIIFWIVTIAIILVWVYFSGIGNYSYQNSDFYVRNPIYRDLCDYSWPVYYDLSQESDLVTSICGTDTVAFSYYFAWWLPAALITKILGLGYRGHNLVLFLWTVCGLIAIMYLLCRKLKKNTWLVPIVVIAFSGMDAIPYLILHGTENIFPWINHMEWWGSYFQLTANTTLLYWGFNQALPCWITVALLLQLKDSKCIAGLCSMIFAYSPWAIFGIVPYAIVASVTSKEKIKKTFNVWNVAVPAVMLLVFGTLFTSSDVVGSNFTGFIFKVFAAEEKQVIINYIMLLIFEFGLYYIAMGKSAVKYEYYWVTLLELILCPTFLLRDTNFGMRSTIPALFFTTYYIIRFFSENDGEKKTKIKKIVLTVLLCIGFLTPLSEIDRSVYNTSTMDNYLREEVYSFGNMQFDNTDRIQIIKDQFFVYDYENAPFFKYLAK